MHKSRPRGGAAMGKNGGKPHDTILTLEEALKRFARKRIENSVQMKDAAVQGSSQVSKVHYADFSPSPKRENEVSREEVGLAREHPPDPSPSDARDALGASKSASQSSEDIVAVIDGIPRTLEDLERMAAADKAFQEDFPESSDEPEFPEDDVSEPAMASRVASRRDFAFCVMGAALLVWIAILVTRVPIVN